MPESVAVLPLRRYSESINIAIDKARLLTIIREADAGSGKKIRRPLRAAPDPPALGHMSHDTPRW